MSLKVMQDKITNSILSRIDELGKDWLKPWSNLGMPMSLATGNRYGGINTIACWISNQENGFTSNQWGTYNQIRTKGGIVIKGQKGTQVVYMQPALYRDARTNETPDTTKLDLNLQKESKVREDGSVQVQYNLYRSYYVFNLDQTEATDTKLVFNKKTKKYDVESCDKSEFENFVKSFKVSSDGADDLPQVDQYVKNTGAEIRYGAKENIFIQNSCYYMENQDYIGMVSKDLFNDNNDNSATQLFYATLLHELTHWTKHKSRLNRDYKSKYFDKFSSKEKYAFEELVAEIGACIQCCMLGVNIQYLKIWKDRLKENPQTIFKASAMAQAGVNLILEKQPKKLKKAVGF